MKTARFPAALLLSLCSACGGDGGGTDDTGSGGTGTGGTSSGSGGSGVGGGSGGGTGDVCTSPVMDDMGNAVVLTDAANNYAFSSTLSFPPIFVAPDSELSFDWSAVTQDFLGHALDPMQNIDSVNLMLWKLPEAELEEKLNNDDLAQRDLAVVATVYTENTITDATLFEFTSLGMPLTQCDILPFVQAPNPDPTAHPECDDSAEWSGYDPATHTYTVMIASGDELGQGTRMIQSFKLDPEATNTEVVVQDTSTGLEYSVDLTSLEPTRVPTGTAAIAMEWGHMTVNALGNEFVTNSITEVMVARYSMSPTELQDRFLDLELIADDLWRGEVSAGTDAPLSSLTNEAGEAFTGIDATSTWIVTLICGGCRNPAPWYLSFLEPCEAAAP